MIKVDYYIYNNKNRITFCGFNQYQNWQTAMKDEFPTDFKIASVKEPRSFKEKISWKIKLLKNDIGLKFGKRNIL